MTSNYTFVETFVGAGGSHRGFENQGFKTIYAADNTEDMIKTLIYNNPNSNPNIFVVEDIKKTTGDKILKMSNLRKKELDVLMGGIVCCGFSLAGVRDPTDFRNRFYKEQLRLVKELRPKISVIENVPGIQSMIIADEGLHEEKKKRIKTIFEELKQFNGKKSAKTKELKTLNTQELNRINKLKKERDILLEELKQNSIKIIDDIKRIYEELGYVVYTKVLNAANYGAATKRERFFIVALRKDLGVKFRWPNVTHGLDNSVNINKFLPNAVKLKPFVTVNEALSTIDYNGVNNPQTDLDNQPMNHTEKSIARFKFIPEGKNIVSVMKKIPKDLQISSFYSRGCTMRLNGNDPSPTLVPGHSNFPVHPKEHRSITVREAAIITGFPKNYRFFGSHTSRCLQVGNAIPVKLAEAIAKEVKNSLDEYYKRIN